MLRFYSFISDAYDPVDHLLDAQRVFAEIRRKHEAQLSDGEFDFLMAATRRSGTRFTATPNSGACWNRWARARPPSPAIESSARFLFQVFAIRVGRKPGMSSARPHEA
jgi:hypothetical protein